VIDHEGIRVGFQIVDQLGLCFFRMVVWIGIDQSMKHLYVKAFLQLSVPE
jgi:hypothetical protein